MMLLEPVFLASDVDAGTFWKVVGGMTLAITGMAGYIVKLHAQNRADLREGFMVQREVADALREDANAKKERTQRVAGD